MEENIKNISNSTELDSDKYSLYSDALASDNTEALNLRYGFEVGGIEFLIRKNQLSEIVRTPKVFPIPNSPASVDGLINHRGSLVPIFKFKSFVYSGDDELNINNDYVLVLDKGEKATAFHIDKIPFTINAEDDELLSSEKQLKDVSDSALQFIEAIYEYKEHLFIDFDFERFFNEITSI